MIALVPREASGAMTQTQTATPTTRQVAPARALPQPAAPPRNRSPLFMAAVGVIALHVIDDSFLQPQPGTSAGDHLVSGLVPLTVADAEQDRDPLGLEAARGEQECFSRWGVEPLCVVDAAERRTLLAGLGQQAQQRERDQEAVRDCICAEPKRAPQRSGLRCRKTIDELDGAPHELVHPRERQLVLGLDPDAAQHVHVLCLLGGVFEQRRLADSGLPAYDEDRAAILSRAPQKRVEPAPLGVSTDQHPADRIPTRAIGD